MNGKRLFPALSDGAGLFPGYLQDLLGQFLVLSRTPEDSGMLNTDYLLGRSAALFPLSGFSWREVSHCRKGILKFSGLIHRG